MSKDQPNCESMLQLPVADFLSRLSERVPAPGGGAAAALTASLAVATGRMAVAYSQGPKTSAGDKQKIEELARQLERAETICRHLVDEDAAAYRAYSETAKQVKLGQASAESFQAAVRLAVSVPLHLAAISLNLLRLLDEHKTLIKAAMLSDLAVAAYLAEAACKSARQTALINIFELEFEDDRTHLYAQCDHFVDTATRLAGQIVAFVDR